MNLIQMKCPSCGASLNVDDGLDSFFCQYCGAKITLSGQSDAAYRAKANVKITEKVSDTVLSLREKRYQQQQAKARQEEEARKKALPTFFVCMLLLAVFGFGFPMLMSHRQQVEIDKQVTQLQAIYAEVQEDIKNGDYDSALLKANQLIFTERDSEIKKQWQQIREDTIKFINEAKANIGG